LNETAIKIAGGGRLVNAYYIIFVSCRTMTIFN